MRSLTRDLSVEFGHVASAIGRDVIGFAARLTAPTSGGKQDADVAPGRRVRNVVIVGERTASAPLPATPGQVDNTNQPLAQGMLVVHEEKVLSTSQGPLPEPPPRTEASVAAFRVFVGRPGEAPLRPPAGSSQPQASQRVLWIDGPQWKTSIPIPDSGLGMAVGRFRDRLLLGSLGILGLGLAVAAVVAHRVTAPLRGLAEAARTVGEGALGTQVPRPAAGEVGEAILAFNRMSSRLKELETNALALRERQHLGELGEVARGLAHALRNPLHAIGLSIEELGTRAGGDASAEELVESARRQIRNIDHSIRSFLALSSGAAGAEEELDGGGLVRDVVLTALHDARGRVRLDLKEAEGPTPVLAVAAELKAAVQALVVNAIESSPDGATVVVSVGAADAGGLRVEVEDDGPGLPAAVRSRLFTPHLTTKPNGSGMGLFLAHRIVTTRYGGSLELFDREPRGTRAVLAFGPRKGALDV